MRPGPIDGLVLAGGAGRRFGRPKAIVPIGGGTLVERAVAQLLSRCSGRVVVASHASIDLPTLPVDVVDDRPGPRAALNGIVAGLAELPSDDVVVLACDLPAVGDILDRLLAADGPVVVAVDELGRRQPLCARYRREPTLRAAERLLADGQLRLSALLDALGPVVEVVAGPGELANVNTPADLANALLPGRDGGLRRFDR
ncbi:MAG: molybdopterin-guanine dinucleotide biosynthesis protein [Acidimicrobiales bacterium]|jgi:molybdopterin-guanine dinucleotide biosynthesis protein A|nr:molybdopterin-guanine dinucleotide biosynthesis protein [Acidimicrobiales bacterium]